MVLNQKAYDYFASLGEVSVNDGGTDKESIIKTIEGATIAVTSWGNEAIDEEVLAHCPDLKFVAHAAGDRKSTRLNSSHAR